jgi:hypothetical protein
LVDLKWPFRRGEEKGKAYNEKERMIRLILMILVPFYVVWGLFNFFFFMQYPIEWSVTVLLCGFFAWGTGIVILMNQRQMEAGQYHCFRSATWRMSVTERIKTDIYVDSKIKYIGVLGGYHVYKPHFPFALFFEHPTFNNREGITFNKAYWLCPEKWDDTFLPIPQQEAWYGAMPVSVKAEDLTLHNLRWIVKKNTSSDSVNAKEYIPVALVTDSNRHFEATLGQTKLNEDEKAPEVAKWVCDAADLATENMDLALEVVAEAKGNQALLKNTDDVVRLYREAMEDAKTRHGDISRVPTESKWQKINWRLVLVGAVALAIVALIGITLLRFW